MRKLIAAWCLLGLGAFGDVVVLKDGTKVTGTVQSAGSRQLLIKTGDESQVIPMDQIASIEFNPVAAPVSAAPPAAAQPQIAAPRQEAVAVSAPVTPPPAAGSSITIPEGTEVAARTIERIDSKKADKYREYAASLDDALVVNGVTIAPRNSNAFLRVTEIKNPKFKGHALLATTLVAVVVNGHRIELQTGDVDSQSGSETKRTAVGAGAGAAGGAAVGAAAGGGAGAAVGAGIGAAAGSVAAALSAKGVQIPPETRFTYTLSHPVTVNAPAASK